MPQDLKQLTSLRFFAAMWVVLYHFWPSLGLATPALAAKGYLGVELFFVLSGFILHHVYLERLGTGGFRYDAFLWARLSRVYPLHLATLVGLGLMAGGAAFAGLSIGDKVLVWPSLVPHLLLVQAWGFAPLGGWNHPSWSISAEWFAYLLFPAFATLAWRLRARPWLAALAAAGLTVVVQESFRRLAGFPLTQATYLWGALRIVPCFALGAAVQLLWSASPLKSCSGAGAFTLATLAVVGACVGGGAPDWATVIAFGALIYGLASLSSAGGRRLTGPAFVYLGEVSFAIYMVCIPWKLIVENSAHRLLQIPGEVLPLPVWLAMLAGVIPAAMVAHHLVERPARAAMRRYGVPFQGAVKRRPGGLSPALQG